MQIKMESKAIVFVAMMAALGNVLSFLSMQLAPLAPNIPLGPVSVSLALDLSHLSTFIAAFFGGPFIGGFTGLIGGLVAAFEFGFSKGNFVTGFGLPIGKALTGITAGYLFRRLLQVRSTIIQVIITVLSYVPEALLTLWLFKYLLPPVSGIPEAVAVGIALQILVKAFMEMVILGIILMVLMNNLSFRVYAQEYFA